VSLKDVGEPILTERYRLGVDLNGLAVQVVSYMDVGVVARPFLRRLAGACQETVNLVVSDADRIFRCGYQKPGVLAVA
jgi:DNA-binding IclR family transcriptional regulator